MTALQILYLYINQITVFPDLALSNIRVLYLHNNHPQTVPKVRSETGSVITKLVLNRNQITEVTVAQLQSMNTLQHLYLHYNDITEFPDIHIIESTLRLLQIDHNNIQYINPEYLHFPTSTNSITLKMYSNQIAFIPEVSAPSAASVTLNLGDNPLNCNTSFVIQEMHHIGLMDSALHQ